MRSCEPLSYVRAAPPHSYRLCVPFVSLAKGNFVAEGNYVVAGALPRDQDPVRPGAGSRELQPENRCVEAGFHEPDRVAHYVDDLS